MEKDSGMTQPAIHGRLIAQQPETVP